MGVTEQPAGIRRGSEPPSRRALADAGSAGFAGSAKSYEFPSTPAHQQPVGSGKPYSGYHLICHGGVLRVFRAGLLRRGRRDRVFRIDSVAHRARGWAVLRVGGPSAVEETR